MLKKEKLYLLTALVVAAQAGECPVTYLVLSLRLHGFGGDRACRALVDELCNEGYIAIDRPADSGDRREKVVSLTEDGIAALSSYSAFVRGIEPRRRPAAEAIQLAST
jgi:hypothetical protein